MYDASLVYQVFLITVKIAPTDAPAIGMYHFSCFTAFEYTISQNRNV